MTRDFRCFFLSLQFQMSFLIFLIICLQKCCDLRYHYQCLAVCLACVTCIYIYISFTFTRHCVTVPLCKYIRNVLIVYHSVSYRNISRCIYIFNYIICGCKARTNLKIGAASSRRLCSIAWNEAYITRD